jgi:hypothetical protein
MCLLHLVPCVRCNYLRLLHGANVNAETPPSPSEDCSRYQNGYQNGTAGDISMYRSSLTLTAKSI